MMSPCDNATDRITDAIVAEADAVQEIVAAIRQRMAIEPALYPFALARCLVDLTDCRKYLCQLSDLIERG